MYDETHQIQITLITKCNLHAHGSLFALLYLGVTISRFIQKSVELEWHTGKPRIYDETHQIPLASITECGLYTHGSLFTVLYVSINISRCIQKSIELVWYTRKPGLTIKLTKYRQNAISMLTVPCSFYCIWVSIAADISSNLE